MSATTRELTCINCPLGCLLTVTLANGEVTAVTGNTCKRGDTYARKEIANPTRIVTTSVPVDGSATERMLSVKTARDIPKGEIFNVMNVLRKTRATAPVEVGDVIVPNVCNTGVDVVATRRA